MPTKRAGIDDRHGDQGRWEGAHFRLFRSASHWFCDARALDVSESRMITPRSHSERRNRAVAPALVTARHAGAFAE